MRPVRYVGLLLVVIAVHSPAITGADRFHDLSNDFDDPELVRVERGDYSIGGPLAKCGSNTTCPPDGSSAAPGPAGSTEKSVGSGTTRLSAATSPSGPKTPEKGGGKGCPITVIPSSVLPEIGSNTAQLPDFNLKYTDDCKSIGDCSRLCDKAACNYFIRSTESEMAHFYKVKADKLKNPNYVESASFDSFVPQCPSEEKLPDFSSKPGTKEPGATPGPGDNGGATTPSPGGVTGEPGGNATARTRKPAEPVDRCPECTLKDKFKKYILANNRSYNPYEEERRFKVFQDNLARISELVKSRIEPADANYTVTKFTDLVFAEFLQSFTGAIPEEDPADKFEEDVGVVPGVPARFDWSDEGVVPEPRDQKDCGSCYAFTTSDLTATQWAIDHGEHKSYVLSPQVVLDCIKEKAAFGCNGGRPYLVLATHANCSRCPWPKESCYPYENKASDKCRTAERSCVETDQPQIHVKHAHYLDVSSGGGEKERLAALLQGGPVAALVQVTDHWQFYSGGIMRASQCNGSASPNHAVLITGYDFTGSVPAYIIKNSWGKDWGEEGYFRIEAGKNTCGIAKFLSFACTADCGDKKSLKQLIDRAIKRQMERGFGTTTPRPQSQGYGIQETFPYGGGVTESPYGGFTFLPIAPPPPKVPTAPPTPSPTSPAPNTQSSVPYPKPTNPSLQPTQTASAPPEPQPPSFSPPPSYFTSIPPGPIPPVSPPGPYSAPGSGNAQQASVQTPTTPAYQSATPVGQQSQPAASPPSATPPPATSPVSSQSQPVSSVPSQPSATASASSAEPQPQPVSPQATAQPSQPTPFATLAPPTALPPAQSYIAGTLAPAPVSSQPSPQPGPVSASTAASISSPQPPPGSVASQSPSPVPSPSPPAPQPVQQPQSPGLVAPTATPGYFSPSTPQSQPIPAQPASNSQGAGPPSNPQPPSASPAPPAGPASIIPYQISLIKRRRRI